jgi:hypothetical protein
MIISFNPSGEWALARGAAVKAMRSIVDQNPISARSNPKEKISYL